MNERIRLSMSQEAFKSWIQPFSFKEHGDSYERQHFDWLDGVFPRLQEFWRVFVVPLTNRIAIKHSSPIDLRRGVDDRLQRIPGLNYSLFIHLCEAKKTIDSGKTKHDLMPIYSRLGAALDCFESLIVEFYLLLVQVGARQSKTLRPATLEQFLEAAKKYYHKHASMLEGYYLKNEKIPQIKIPEPEDLIKEYFGSNPVRSQYKAAAQKIRPYRNRLVHDIRVGVIEHKGELFAPKPEKLALYQRWSDVQAAESDPANFENDFRNAYEGAAKDVNQISRLMNELYGKILQDFEAAFYLPKSQLRELYGIEFNEVTGDPLSLQMFTIASSGAVAGRDYPTSGTGIIDERHHSASGYFKAAIDPESGPAQK